MKQLDGTAMDITSLILNMGVLLLLALASITDLRTLRLPLGLLKLSMLLSLALGAVQGDLLSRLMGLVAAGLLIAGIRWFYARYRQLDAIGRGDIYLAGAIGAWLGWEGLATAFFYAAIGALACALLARLAGRNITARTKLPFGPFLTAGATLVWFLGPLLPGSP